jgi:hypothetical protein
MISSAEEFVQLRRSEDQEEYSRSSQEEASIEVWNAVLENYPDMAFWVAQNKTVPYEILEVLASHTDSRVRSMVASKNKLKEALLLKLASDQDDSVRMSVARHKKATVDVLNQLTNDRWEEISIVALERIKSASHK